MRVGEVVTEIMPSGYMCIGNNERIEWRIVVFNRKTGLFIVEFKGQNNDVRGKINSDAIKKKFKTKYGWSIGFIWEWKESTGPFKKEETPNLLKEPIRKKEKRGHKRAKQKKEGK